MTVKGCHRNLEAALMPTCAHLEALGVGGGEAVLQTDTLPSSFHLKCPAKVESKCTGLGLYGTCSGGMAL